MTDFDYLDSRDIRYSESHEWVRKEADGITVGISDYAQEQLGDIVFVEVAELGSRLNRGDLLGTMESVKAASELYAPVSGEVVEINPRVIEEPELVNRDPLGDGWLARLHPLAPEEFEGLMSDEEYRSYREGLEA